MPLNAGGANGTTTLSVLARQRRRKNGCNLTWRHDSSPFASLRATRGRDGQPVVAPSPSGRARHQVVTVTPVAVGATTISLSQTSNSTEGTFDVAPATVHRETSAACAVEHGRRRSPSTGVALGFVQQATVPAATLSR
jgi:hypothetical protein